MNKHRVKAFTIIEVTITMLIAAILIGITYTSYSIISRSTHSFEARNNDMAAIGQLDQLLRRDFMKAELIQKDSGTIEFKSRQGTITYQFDPDFIIRFSGITDTFKVKNEGLKVMFEGQPLNEVNSSAEQNRLDELEINLIYQNENIPYHYYKQYSSSDLIKRKPNALN